MNPFTKYPGLKLNGQFYSKEEILKADYTNIPDYEKDILEFAKLLFDNCSELSFKTSGSTGEPKEIHFLKEAVLLSSKATNAFFNIQDKQILLTLPLSFVAGKLVISRAIIGNSEIIARKPTSRPLQKGISFDFAPLTPHQFGSVLEDQKEFLPEDAVILLGGGAVSKPILEKIKYLPNQVYLGFGMTETLTHFALRDLKAESFEFEILEGTSIAVDKEGRLRVKREGITSGWITTNDLIEITEKGFIWKGRADNLINSGGIKINPEKVEAMLSSAIEEDFFVAGIPSEEFGEKLVLFVEGKNQPDISRIKFEKAYEKPKDIFLLDRFIRTSSGKIRRRETINKIFGH